MAFNTMYALNAAVRSAYILKKWERSDFMNDIKARVDLLLAYGADINAIGAMDESVAESATSNPDIFVYLMDKGADHHIYGKRVLRFYRDIFKSGSEVKPYQDAVIRRLSELGY